MLDRFRRRGGAHQQGDVLRQLVGVGSVISQQDLAHAFDLGGRVSHGGAALASDQYFDDDPTVPSSPLVVDVTLPDTAFTMETDRGVFSHGHLDTARRPRR